MPAPRKVNLLPEELRVWLKQALVARGFADYDGLAEDLNFRLEEAGLDLRIQKSALHEFGAEYREFVRTQEAASAWAEGWMRDAGIADQAKRTDVLFQMITATAFKVLQAKMLQGGEEIDPKELHFLGRMMKDVVASSGVMQAMVAKEREAARKEMAAKLEAAVEAGEATPDFMREARRLMGFG